jgi:hypothetical protein
MNESQVLWGARGQRERERERERERGRGRRHRRTLKANLRVLYPRARPAMRRQIEASACPARNSRPVERNDSFLLSVNVRGRKRRSQRKCVRACVRGAGEGRGGDQFNTGRMPIWKSTGSRGTISA